MNNRDKKINKSMCLEKFKIQQKRFKKYLEKKSIIAISSTQQNKNS